MTTLAELLAVEWHDLPLELVQYIVDLADPLLLLFGECISFAYPYQHLRSFTDYELHFDYAIVKMSITDAAVTIRYTHDEIIISELTIPSSYVYPMGIGCTHIGLYDDKTDMCAGVYILDQAI